MEISSIHLSKNDNIKWSKFLSMTIAGGSSILKLYLYPQPSIHYCFFDFPEWIWKTDLDFMVMHRDRLVVLSFMTSNVTGNAPSSISQARIISGTNKPPIGVFSPTAGVPLNHNPVAHTVIKALKDIVGQENHTQNQLAGGKS